MLRSRPAAVILSSVMGPLAIALALAAVPSPAPGSAAPAQPTRRIDRHALVSRHNPVLRGVDPRGALSVGNGRFAFTIDATGLQSFGEPHQARGIPTETLARWAWRSSPNPKGFRLEDADETYRAYGRLLQLPTNADGQAGQWLRKNPADHPLAVLRLVLGRDRGGLLQPEQLTHVEQTLELWSGIVTSRYKLGGTAVRVTTACHPTIDQVAIRIESELLSAAGLGVELAFPRGHDASRKNTPPLDWGAPESHVTRLVGRSPGRARIERQVDDLGYQVGLEWTGEASLGETGPHRLRLDPRASGGRRSLELVVAFSPDRLPRSLPGVALTLAASKARWKEFWLSGAAVDFSGSRDPRAHELERRVVLSQYLTALQSAGDVPPQETGLTCSSWYGKHHTEMIWWHVAHFALWGRDEYVAKALAWYERTLPVARRIAAARGLRGARWPKMVGPEGRESPGGNPLIVWNQPHVVSLAELLYRSRPGPDRLRRYRELVMATAECMASMLHLAEPSGRYVLGPPLWIAQEIYDPRRSVNPSFELAYWRFGLDLAQRWRERLGLGRSAEWDDILRRLSPLPQKDGRYVALESVPDTFDNRDSRHDHPTMLAPLGLLPGPGVDPDTMRRTLDAVLATWDWETKIWGWDYPMIAMTAARLGQPERAVEVLLRDGPNNDYSASGHCPQRGDLAVYLPANGALLAAVAMMAGGWDGAPALHAPGFPQDGSWTVRAEGLRRLP